MTYHPKRRATSSGLLVSSRQPTAHAMVLFHIPEMIKDKRVKEYIQRQLLESFTDHWCLLRNSTMQQNLKKAVNNH